MIETDMLYAYVKKEDWLKPAANKLFPNLGEFNRLCLKRLSQDMLFQNGSVSTDELIARWPNSNR
jgi:hypothetical protein